MLQVVDRLEEEHRHPIEQSKEQDLDATDKEVLSRNQERRRDEEHHQERHQGFQRPIDQVRRSHNLREIDRDPHKDKPSQRGRGSQFADEKILSPIHHLLLRVLHAL
jgi:hypothetical protein